MRFPFSKESAHFLNIETVVHLIRPLFILERNGKGMSADENGTCIIRRVFLNAKMTERFVLEPLIINLFFMLQEMHNFLILPPTYSPKRVTRPYVGIYLV